MKLKHVTIRNFKGVRSVEFPTHEAPGALSRLTALLGDNGSGKTSILQAIALTLSMATRRTRDVSSFEWHGFVPERLSSLGSTLVELQVAFDAEEIQLTSHLFGEWESSISPERRQTMRLVPPSLHPEVTLRFENGRVTSPQGFEACCQFLGRWYVKQLISARPDLRDYFGKLGDVFWFDQYRNLGTRTEPHDEDGKHFGQGWQAGVTQLREYLVRWWGVHTSPYRNGRDLIIPLRDTFSKVFIGTNFIGIDYPGPGTGYSDNEVFFLLERDGRVYDLAEMSSGEQAVFPLAYEFTRLEIKRSIVLIDELELHLHPPEQQRLLSALPLMGPDCQFLITTHSEFLTSAIPNEQEVRLEGGIRCL